MASPNTDAPDELLYKFTKILALKVAQIVVQSRQGKKITHNTNATKTFANGSSSPNLQWFNLSIPDEPDVNSDTKRVLNGEIVDALSKVLCIEISMWTTDSKEIVLEYWTMKMLPGNDSSTMSTSTVYYRMSSMLKSTLSISRITPAYRMSRAQSNDTYKIYHKIYSGLPNADLLGENIKVIKVCEMTTSIGTILIEVTYRPKMPQFVTNTHNTVDGNIVSGGDIMIKSDHFPKESPKITSESNDIDLSKPLSVGAFVDAAQIQELHDALSQQLPPEPPMTWLLAEKEKMEEKISKLHVDENTSEKKEAMKAGCSGASSSSFPNACSKAIEVPRAAAKNGDKYTSLIEFPFAEGSPITELANFYQECLQARSTSEEWTDLYDDMAASNDSESLSQQLKMYEDAIPEFDSMVASMFSNSEHGSDG